jgi:hypothetical protein
MKTRPKTAHLNRPRLRRAALRSDTQVSGGNAATQQDQPATGFKPNPTQTKIFPRNLTARAEFLVAGNPMNTRPEDALANCYPGLELDVRNFDRRFFPGLVFNFIEPPDDTKPGMHYGAKLAYVDVLEDPDLQLNVKETQHRLYTVMGISKDVAQSLYGDLMGDKGNALNVGNWFLDWIEQGGRRISTSGDDGDLHGLMVWRLIRGLEPKLVSIGLRRRAEEDDARVELRGWRRLFTDPVTGVISGAYQPGELMQGLCSPWQHDFRDCYCHYWASNRPDVVLGEVYPGERVLPGGEADDPLLNIRVDWMRADRSREMAVEAFGIIEKNRPYQFDHYQINHDWEKLNIVLEGREIDSVRLSEPIDAANPFETPKDLINELRYWLTPLELTLVFEYLYARFSLRNPEDVRDESLKDALLLTREYLLLIAISEMQHLRWGNEILWELHKAGLVSDYEYEPILNPNALVPKVSGGALQRDKMKDTIVKMEKTKENIAKMKDEIGVYVKAEHKTTFRPRLLTEPTREALAEFQKICGDTDSGWRPAALRLLTEEVQQDFINIEHPSAYIDGAYARVVATLRLDNYGSPKLLQLAQRIVGDGMEHEARFNAIRAALRPFNQDDYLRSKMTLGSKKKTKTLLDQRDTIIRELREAYTSAARESITDCAEHIAAARATMNDLLKDGEELAKKDIGIPFFEALIAYP